MARKPDLLRRPEKGTLKKRGAPKLPRISSAEKSRLENLVRSACSELPGYTLTKIDADLGKPTRWMTNAFSRTGGLALRDAELLYRWLLSHWLTPKKWETDPNFGDRTYVQKRLSAIELGVHPAFPIKPPPVLRRNEAGNQRGVPLLIDERDVLALANALSEYLETRHQGVSLKQAVKNFFSRSTGGGSTYRVRCASEFTRTAFQRAKGHPKMRKILVGKHPVTTAVYDPAIVPIRFSGRAEKKGRRARNMAQVTIGIGDELATVGPEDIRKIVYAIEVLTADKPYEYLISNSRKAQ